MEWKKLSFELANRLYGLTLIVTLAGSIVTLVSAGALLYLAPTREAYWQQKLMAAEHVAPVAPLIVARHLTDSQKRDLQYELSRHAAEIKVRVQRPQTDLEARAFADEIVAVLAASGVEFDVNTYGAIDPPLYGVALVRDDTTPHGGDALIAAFQQSNIPIKLLSQPGLDRVQLIVGQNPQP